MNELVLPKSVMDNLDAFLGELETKYQKSELEPIEPIMHDLCKPCKGGCGNLTSLIGRAIEFSPEER